MKKNILLSLMLSVFFFSFTKNISKTTEYRNIKIKAPEIKLEGIYNKTDSKIPTLESLKGGVNSVGTESDAKEN